MLKVFAVFTDKAWCWLYLGCIETIQNTIEPVAVLENFFTLKPHSRPLRVGHIGIGNLRHYTSGPKRYFRNLSNWTLSRYSKELFSIESKSIHLIMSNEHWQGIDNLNNDILTVDFNSYFEIENVLKHHKWALGSTYYHI